MSEESKMIALQEVEDENDALDLYYAYPAIPYSIIEDEVGIEKKTRYNTEFTKIRLLYSVYKKGAVFVTEGSNSDYIPSTLRYKKASMIINKEARFLFANPPSFNINPDNVDNKNTDDNAVLQNFLNKVLEKNSFNANLLKAAKDCFIGKRIAIVLNFGDNGIVISFLKSLDFVYETSSDKPGELTKFVCFELLNGAEHQSEQKWFKKKYEKIDDEVYLEEYIYSGNGEILETITERERIDLPYIPAVVVINDALLGDEFGTSELEPLVNYEEYYSKLANADMDAERKSMNPIRWTIDASNDSTKVLSTSPGSYWDLQTDQDKPNENTSARVGTLEANMTYSNPLKTTLDRIENEMYNEVDVPNITSEQLAGVITSGKTLQALYWGLTVRCDEKMLEWGSCLQFIAIAIIEGGKIYPNSIKPYTEKKKLPTIPYNVVVKNNYPLPEDEKDKKELDISEVEGKIMSRKAYMKKWRGLSDEEANNELQQIKLEQDLLESLKLNYQTDNNGNQTEIRKTDEFTNTKVTKTTETRAVTDKHDSMDSQNNIP